MDIDELATKPTGRAARKRRRKPKQRVQREQVCDVYLATIIGLVEGTDPQSQGDTFMGRIDPHLQEGVQAESAMKQAFERLDIQEISSCDMSKQISTELDNKLAAAPVKQKQKTFNPCSKEVGPLASSTLQLNRYFKTPFLEMTG